MKQVRKFEFEPDRKRYANPKDCPIDAANIAEMLTDNLGQPDEFRHYSRIRVDHRRGEVTVEYDDAKGHNPAEVMARIRGYQKYKRDL